MAHRLKNLLGTRVGMGMPRQFLHRHPPNRLSVELVLFLMAAMACCGLLAHRPATAQDDWDVAERAANQPAVGQMGGAMEGINVSFRDLVQNIFTGKSRSQVERMLMNRFTLVLKSVERTCELTEAQRKKLELAAQGDMDRFFREVEQLREQLNEVKGDRHKLNLVFQAIQPLRTKLNTRFFDEDSLLYKVLQTTLNPEQALQYEKQQQKRREFLYEARIELAVAMLETGVPLCEAQRQQFIELLLDQTEPPKKFGEHDYRLILYQAGKLDEAKLKSIFDDAQWRAIEQALEQARGLEEHWRQAGLIP